MRKNGIIGPIKGAGRKKSKDQTEQVTISLQISKEAREALNKIPRLERGQYITRLLLDAANFEDLL